MYLVLNKKFKKGLIAAAVLAVIIVGIAVAVAASGHIWVRELSAADITDNSAVTLISHRGMSAKAPENTLEAAVRSAENGYSHVEFDIRRTRDGVWVLMHDSDIKRTTDGEGDVSSLTYKQILSHRIDEGKNLDEPLSFVITVPTLEEMLEICAENKLMPVIEIKQSGTEYIPELLSFIAARRNTDLMIITFDREQAQLIHTLVSTGQTTFMHNGVKIYWLTNDLDADTLEAAKAVPEIGVSFNGNEAGSQKEIDAFKSEGIDLACWTVDSASRLKKLYKRGITTFTTNAIIYNTAEE